LFELLFVHRRSEGRSIVHYLRGTSAVDISRSRERDYI
jgi:hypothetical protein